MLSPVMFLGFWVVNDMIWIAFRGMMREEGCGEVGK
jgi:hypothetical protein